MVVVGILLEKNSLAKLGMRTVIELVTEVASSCKLCILHARY